MCGRIVFGQIVQELQFVPLHVLDTPCEHIFDATLRELEGDPVAFFYVKPQCDVEHFICIHAVHYFI